MKKILILTAVVISFNSVLSASILPNFSDSRERRALADALVTNSPVRFKHLLKRSVTAAESSAMWSEVWSLPLALLSVICFSEGQWAPLALLANSVKNAFVEGGRAGRNEELKERAKEVFAVLNRPEFQKKWGVTGWADSAKKAKRAEIAGFVAQLLALVVSGAAYPSIQASRYKETLSLASVAAISWSKFLVAGLVRLLGKAPNMDAVYNDALKIIADAEKQSVQ